MKRALIGLLTLVLLLCGCLSRGKGEVSNDVDNRPEVKKRVPELSWLVVLPAEDEGRGRLESLAGLLRERGELDLELLFVEPAGLKSELARLEAAGSGPQLVGPLDLAELRGYREFLLEIEPSHIEEELYKERVLELYRGLDGEYFLGLPFTVSPSFIYYNRRLFDEAGMPYPPGRFGEDYIDELGISREWDIDTLQKVAMKLTLDSAMNSAGSRGFKRADIIQFGFSQQGTGARGFASLFGPGTLVSAGGKAMVPENWRKAWKWYYSAMWEERFHPSGKYHGYRYLGKGDYFRTGNIAMAHIDLSYALEVDLKDIEWLPAVVPSYNGGYSARLDGTALALLKGGVVNSELMEGLGLLLADEELYKLFRGMPALKGMQREFLQSELGSKMPGSEPDWQVIIDSQDRAFTPYYRELLPNNGQSARLVDSFWGKCRNEPGLDLDYEIDRFESYLQRLFDKEK